MLEEQAVCAFAKPHFLFPSDAIEDMVVGAGENENILYNHLNNIFYPV